MGLPSLGQSNTFILILVINMSFPLKLLKLNENKQTENITFQCHSTVAWRSHYWPGPCSASLHNQIHQPQFLPIRPLLCRLLLNKSHPALSLILSSPIPPLSTPLWFTGRFQLSRQVFEVKEHVSCCVFPPQTWCQAEHSTTCGTGDVASRAPTNAVLFPGHPISSVSLSLALPCFHLPINLLFCSCCWRCYISKNSKPPLCQLSFPMYV